MKQVELGEFYTTEEKIKADSNEQNSIMNSSREDSGMPLDELKKKMFRCADHLRGAVTEEKYKNYIPPVLFMYALEGRVEYMQTEIISGDEDISEDRALQLARDRLQYRIPMDTRVKDISSSTSLPQDLDDWFQEFEENNGTELRDRDFTDEKSLTHTVLKKLRDEVRTIDFTNTPPDLLGEAYMYLMKNEFYQAEGGEYFTPPKYSQLVARIPYVLSKGFSDDASFHDPTSGSAGLLIETASLLRDDPNDLIESPAEDLSEIKDKHRITGQEKNSQIYKLGLMNASIHGIDGTDLRQGDSLSSPQFKNGSDLEKFDYVVANPPFSEDWDKDKLKSDTRFDWGAKEDKYPRANRADYAFLMHMLAHTSEEGMVSSVVPHGVLFRNSEAVFREYLVRNDYIEAIVNMPEDLFESTSAPTAILVLNKDKSPRHEDEVIFVNADIEDRFYYDTGSSRTELLTSGIEEITQIVRNWEDNKRVSRVVSTDEIAEFDYNLTFSLYVDTTEPQEDVNVTDTLEDITTLETEYDQLNNQLHTYMQQLNYTGDTDE